MAKTNLKIAEAFIPPEAEAKAPPRPLRRSVSKQMQERFERRRVWRRFVAFAYVAILAVYLGWRFTIINPDSLFLSVTYYLTDVIGFILGITAIIITWDYNHRDPPPAPKGLSVDVFVPAYKEQLNIIRRTVMAAKAIDYPHNTWLLDDGKRDELRQLAEELGVRYLRRPDNLHAKAGNLNYALAHSTAEFVMTFDADHIALPHALDVTLGFFTGNPKLAMVQTPQDFYNTDAFQYMESGRTGGMWHDQSYFYNIMLSSGDAINAASCVGTGVVYRRSALDSIGGIPTDTVTEDLHTSLKLHKAGFRSVYLNEPIAYGMAAVDLDEYCTTRLRWGHGNTHALACEKIFTCKGLSWRQRYQYLAMSLNYIEGWQQLLLFAVPVLALTLGLQPFQITIFNMLVVMFFPILSYVMLQEMGCGFTRYWANEVFSMARWPLYIKSFAGMFQRKIPFRSSSKKLRGGVNWRLMAPQVTVLVVSLAALAFGIMKLDGDYEWGVLFRYMSGAVRGAGREALPQGIDVNTHLTGGYTLDLVVVAGFWALYSATRAGFFIAKTIQGVRNSHEFYRFKIPVPAIIDAAKGRFGCVTSVSEAWAQLRLCPGQPLPAAGERVSFTLVMPAGPLELHMHVEKVSGAVVEGALLWPSPQEQDKLANGLYSVDWHREFLHRNAYFMTPSDVVMSCLRLQSPFRLTHGVWQAALLDMKGDGGQGYGVIARKTGSPDMASLVTFGYLPPGTVCPGLSFGGGAPESLRVVIMEEEPLSSLVEKGLDGAEARRYAIRIVA